MPGSNALKPSSSGRGFSGLLAAFRLKQHHLNDFVMLERSCDLGRHLAGLIRIQVLRWMSPPACILFLSCPIPSEKSYASQGELLAYTNHIIDKFHLREHARTNQAVTALTWDESQCAWQVEVASGERYVARFVIDTSGVLANPRTPLHQRRGDLPGGVLPHRAMGSQAVLRG
jgi:cation diffusion facilitator CzcD-associated flavoprotein CzcO